MFTFYTPRDKAPSCIYIYSIYIHISICVWMYKFNSYLYLEIRYVCINVYAQNVYFYTCTHTSWQSPIVSIYIHLHMHLSICVRMYTFQHINSNIYTSWNVQWMYKCTHKECIYIQVHIYEKKKIFCKMQNLLQDVPPPRLQDVWCRTKSFLE